LFLLACAAPPKRSNSTHAATLEAIAAQHL
jgi:hypothetical protein